MLVRAKSETRRKRLQSKADARELIERQAGESPMAIGMAAKDDYDETTGVEGQRVSVQAAYNGAGLKAGWSGDTGQRW